MSIDDRGRRATSETVAMIDDDAPPVTDVYRRRRSRGIVRAGMSTVVVLALAFAVVSTVHTRRSGPKVATSTDASTTDRIIAVTNDGAIVELDHTGAQTRELTPSPTPYSPTSVSTSTTDAADATSTSPRPIKAVMLASGAVLYENTFDNYALDALTTLDGSTIASISTPRMWSPSPDGTRVALVAADGKLTIVDLASGRHLDTDVTAVEALGWSGDGSTVRALVAPTPPDQTSSLASVSADTAAVVSSTPVDPVLTRDEFHNPDSSHARDIAILPDGRIAFDVYTTTHPSGGSGSAAQVTEVDLFDPATGSRTTVASLPGTVRDLETDTTGTHLLITAASGLTQLDLDGTQTPISSSDNFLSATWASPQPPELPSSTSTAPVSSSTTTSVPATDGWTDFTAPDGSFSIRFPGPPYRSAVAYNTRFTSNGSVIAVDGNEAAQRDQRLYVVMWATLPVAPSSTSVFYDDACAYRASMGATPVSSTDQTIGGVAARVCTIRYANASSGAGGRTEQWAYVLSGLHLFVMYENDGISTPGGPTGPNLFEPFIASFRLGSVSTATTTTPPNNSFANSPLAVGTPQAFTVQHNGLQYIVGTSPADRAGWWCVNVVANGPASAHGVCFDGTLGGYLVSQPAVTIDGIFYGVIRHGATSVVDHETTGQCETTIVRAPKLDFDFWVGFNCPRGGRLVDMTVVDSTGTHVESATGGITGHLASLFGERQELIDYYRTHPSPTP